MTTLTLNPSVRFLPLDGDSREDLVLCEVPRARGGPARFGIPAPLVQLLREFDGSRPTGEVVRAHAVRQATARTPEELERLVSEFLVPRGLLRAAGEGHDPSVPTLAPARRRSYLAVRMPLFPARVVAPVAGLLSLLFARPLFVGGVALALAAHAVFYLALLPAHALTADRLQGDGFLAVSLMVAAGAMIHEFGHAAAAARFGCRRTEIGWGLYLHMVVFYADLSEAWRLPRAQRALVDVGGLHFQALCQCGLLGWHLATGSVLPLYGFLFTDILMAAALNPFLRLDGYWLLSDAFGILNLRDKSLALVRHAAERVRSLRDGTPPPVWDLGPRATRVLSVYLVLGTGFFVFLTDVLVRRIALGLAVTYPAILSRLAATLVADPFDAAALAGALGNALWRGLALFGMGLFLYRTITMLVRGVPGALRLLRPAPAPRTPSTA